MNNKSANRIKRMTVMAVLCALAYLCTFLLHFKVSFLTFDFKDAVIAIPSLIYGPLAGVFSSAIVSFIEFITVSDTGVYGLIMNFISSACFSGVIGLIYKYRRTFSGAIIAVTAAVFSVTAIMMLANLFITPFYMGVPRGEVLKLIPSMLLPFNLVKSIMNASLTLIIYKPITKALGSMALIGYKQAPQKNTLRSVILLLCALAVAAAALLFFIFYLKGTVDM